MAAAVKVRANAPAPAAKVRDRPRSERPAGQQAPAVREYLRENIVLGYN